MRCRVAKHSDECRKGAEQDCSAVFRGWCSDTMIGALQNCRDWTLQQILLQRKKLQTPPKLITYVNFGFSKAGRTSHRVVSSRV
eukprot:6479957-Amphidinium_carterae.1